MPLARILTHFPEHAGTLSEELHRRGYTVEFASPERAGKAPADLEIDFEICAEPDALSRASELAEQLHADVAVSPGAVYEHEFETATRAADPVHESLPELERRDALPEYEIIAAEEPVGEAEPAAMETARSAVAESHLPLQTIAEPATQYAEQSVPAAETAFDEELDIARAAARDNTALENKSEQASHEPVRAAEKASEIAARLGERSAAALQATGVIAAEVWASARHWSQEFWASARQRSQEYNERFQVHRAEARAERQRKLLELEKRRALAQERAAELEAAREAAALRLQQLLRERGALTDAQPAPPQKMAAASGPASASNGGVFSRGIFPAKIRIPLAARAHRPQLEAVLVGVAAAGLLFVVGVAVASFHTSPAISSSFNQPSSGVTVQGGGVTVKAGNSPARANAAPAMRAARTQPAGKPSAAIHQRSTGDVTIRKFSPAPGASSPRASNADRVSDDVTIRHFGAAGGKASAQSPPRAELKHYSDLDN
jgi:hypothetical protein